MGTLHQPVNATADKESLPAGEKEFFKGFIEDYCDVLKELKVNKDQLAQQRAENEQIKTMRGDPIAL